jgi:hypothetical protein
LIFQYGPFHEPLNRESLGILHIKWTRTDLFRDWKNPRNQWFAHIIRKGAFKKPFDLKTRRHPPRSQFLDDILNTGLEKAATVFNNVRVIVCYDSESYWAFCAALCGCIVVIVPTPGVSRREFWKNYQKRKYGIAYGWWDLPRAILTRNRILDSIKDEEQINQQNIHAYLKIVEDYFCERT